jgi:ketosteroid isomerase-like protein
VKRDGIEPPLIPRMLHLSKPDRGDGAIVGFMMEPGGSADMDTFARLFREWDEALVANDAERLAAFATEGWMFVSQDGVVPGSRFLAAVGSGAVVHDFFRSEVKSVVDLGDVAVVVVRVVNTGVFQGERFDNDEWSSDVFVRREGRWLCEVTHLTPARATPQEGAPAAGPGG